MCLPDGLARVLADGLFPTAARWADSQERRIQREGVPLDGEMLSFAESIGIHRVGEIRVMEVSRIPLPAPVWTTRMAARLGLPVFEPVGMALGRGIYLLPGRRSSLPHELVHVLQYQRCGGIPGFMREYLRQCLAAGYAGAALEQEAREMAGGIRP